MSEEFRAFWSVIPATVLDDMSIPANAKILYGVISSLMRREGFCWATNAQLAESMHCSEDVISRWVSALTKAGHIRVFVEPNRSVGGNIRRIYPSLPAPVFDAGKGISDIRPISPEAGGISDKCPTGISDKNPRDIGQKSESYIMSNNKIKKEKEMREIMSTSSTLIARCEQYGCEVSSAMQRFLRMRAEIKKPIKSKQAATMLWNKLLDLSGGNAAHMAALLDKATERQWLSLYPLRDDELPQQSDVVESGGMRFL